MSPTWEELSRVQKLLTRLRWWSYDRMSHPRREEGEAWVWTHIPAELTWWILVPKWAQRRFVHWSNSRYCARYGHDDSLWHLHMGGPITPRGWTKAPIEPPEPICGDCTVRLTGCTGRGWHRDERHPVTS